MRNKKLLISIFLTSLLIPFFLVNAFELELDWPKSPGGTIISPTTEIHELIKYIYEWGISLGVIASFIALVIAGVKYMSSTGNTTKIAEAREDIKYSLGGVVLLLCTWLILNTINPDLKQLKELKFNPSTDGWPGLTVKISASIEGQGAFAVFYAGKNFTGKEELLIDPGTIFSRGGLDFPKNFHPESYIAYRPLFKIHPETREDIEEEEKERCKLLNKENPLFCREIGPNSLGIKEDEKIIRDDSCIVELYAPNSFFNWPGSCGDKALSFPGAVADVEKTLNIPSGDIRCYRIIP